MDFRQFLDHERQVEGYFMRDAMIAWDFLLTTQRSMIIAGHFLEIGVWQGKSAMLGAMYLKPEEKAVLIDISPCDAAVRRVRDLKPEGVEFVQAPSYAAVRAPVVQRLVGQYRFIHIDGDHTGYSATGDLAFAASAICEEGIICMDDFCNSNYPQLQAAIWRFLFDHQQAFRMVLCGAGKAFIVRASHYRLWENIIRKYFIDYSAAYGATFTLHKSSYAHDFGCFAINSAGTDKGPGRRLFGLDSDNDDVVF